MFPVAVDLTRGPWFITFSPNSAREVIDAPLPQDVPSLPPPPGGLTTARTSSTSCVLFYYLLYDIYQLQKIILILIHTCEQSSSYVNLHVNIAILSGFQNATKNLWALLMDHWMEAFTHQRWSILKEIHDSVFIHFLQGHVSVSNWFSHHLVSGESRLSESLFSSFYSVITFIFDASGFAIHLLSLTD